MPIAHSFPVNLEAPLLRECPEGPTCVHEVATWR